MDKEVKSKLRADYEHLQANRFWNFYLMEIEEIRKEIVNLVITAPDYNRVLLEQGMIQAIDRVRRLPEKLAKEIGK